VTHPQTIGVVLAGGLARRMGGSDKTRIEIGGRTILDRTLARLRPQCDRMIISANSDPAGFAEAGLPVVPDSVPDYAGPLAGILAGLDWVAGYAPAIAWIASAPNDCPFQPHDLVAHLHRARVEANAQLACACSGERRHPVVALWPVGLRHELRRALAEGVCKVAAWTARYPIGIAAWPATPIDPFFNVNTPEDAAEAARLAAKHPEFCD
jgi:molybdopterin-guanine dinucleotide biosynthesis protein A